MEKNLETNQIQHVLICISSSKLSRKTILTAADLAMRNHARLSAIYVKKNFYLHRMSLKEKQELEWNLSQAEKEGAQVFCIYGKDVVTEVANFVKKNQVDCVVLGKSLKKRPSFSEKESIAKKLQKKLPDTDIYIHKQSNDEENFLLKKQRKESIRIIKDVLFTFFILSFVTICGFFMESWGFRDINIIMIYIVGVLLTGIFTSSLLSSFICFLYSGIAVFAFNYFFISPVWTFKVYDKSYIGTFFVMFITAFLISSITHKMKNMASVLSLKANRTELLLETSQKLQKAIHMEDVMQKMSWQISHLLEKNVLYFMGHPSHYEPNQCIYQKKIFHPLSPIEMQAAIQAYELNRHTGYATDICKDSRYLFLTVRNGEKIFSIVGIDMEKEPISSFEEGVLLAMLSECALAMEKEEFVAKQNEAFSKLKQEQLRANLLRSISHDLRTPLTSISGNASALLLNSKEMSEEQKKRMYVDIQEDSLWLINLVENLLSVTRIENGTMQLNFQTEIVSDVVEEAISHIRTKPKQKLIYKEPDEILAVKMDARLMIQVLTNLLNNAVKYSYDTSLISVKVFALNEECVIEVCDDGAGICDEEKEHIFDMFYSAQRKVIDGRRGMGLGLSLCRSILLAHNGRIEVHDCEPHGAKFQIYLRKEEITLC